MKMFQYYHRIAKTPRPLLYLELEYSSRKMQKKHTILFSKISNTTLILKNLFAIEFNPSIFSE